MIVKIGKVKIDSKEVIDFNLSVPMRSVSHGSEFSVVPFDRVKLLKGKSRSCSHRVGKDLFYSSSPVKGNGDNIDVKSDSRVYIRSYRDRIYDLCKYIQKDSSSGVDLLIKMKNGDIVRFGCENSGKDLSNPERVENPDSFSSPIQLKSILDRIGFSHNR